MSGPTEQQHPDIIAPETLVREHDEELKYYRQRNLSLSHAVTKLSNQVAQYQQHIGGLQAQINMLNNRLARQSSISEVESPELVPEPEEFDPDDGWRGEDGELLPPDDPLEE